MTKYVVGFVFNNYEEAVVLMLKARPDWQKGNVKSLIDNNINLFKRILCI